MGLLRRRASDYFVRLAAQRSFPARRAGVEFRFSCDCKAFPQYASESAGLRQPLPPAGAQFARLF
jgi:hypothetical protein